MSRTYRNPALKHYWGSTKKEAQRYYDRMKGSGLEQYAERYYKLYGTDSKNYSHKTHWYFNRAHRVGRRLERDYLRPHKVLDEDFDFDDSKYTAKYKGVWWEIY